MPCSSLVSPGLAALNTYRVHPLVRGDGYFYALDSTTFTYAFPGDISLGFGIFLARGLLTCQLFIHRHFQQSQLFPPSRRVHGPASQLQRRRLWRGRGKGVRPVLRGKGELK